MSNIDLAIPSPTEGDIKRIDIKQAAIQVQPIVSTPILTPATTPDEKSPADVENMTGKKIFALERPDDKARELAARLTLEEQVGPFSNVEKCLGIPPSSNTCSKGSVDYH